MKRRRDLLARLEASYAMPLRRPGVLRLLPADAPGAAKTSALAPQLDEVGALDTWYQVEDLWLRLGTLLPLAVESDRDQRCLHWLGLRLLAEPDTGLLCRHAAELNTYQWREAGQRRSLVKLLAWQQDDLLLDLMPTRQLLRWAEGDVLASLLNGHLARHATSLPRAEATATAWRSAPVRTG